LVHKIKYIAGKTILPKEWGGTQWNVFSLTLEPKMAFPLIKFERSSKDETRAKEIAKKWNEQIPKKQRLTNPRQIKGW
jgi:hypothetical protein